MAKADRRKQQEAEWQALCAFIQEQTRHSSGNDNASILEREKRVAKTRKDYGAFVETYFSHIATKPTAKFQKDAVRISYRKSDEVKFDNDDPEKFVLWADKNFPSLLKYAAPVPKKDDIKKAIKAGMEVDFAHIESKNNILVK